MWATLMLLQILPDGAIPTVLSSLGFYRCEDVVRPAGCEPAIAGFESPAVCRSGWRPVIASFPRK